MFVKEILVHKGNAVTRIGPDRPLEDAAALMRIERIGALVVSDEGGPLRGIISEKDVVRAISDYGARALSRPVSDFMDERPVTCAPGESLAVLAKKMTLHRARHVPVVEDARVAGIISIGDVVKARFEEMEIERDTLRDIALSHRLAV